MLQNILNKIAAKRLEKNFSQQYMATRLNITQGYYNKLENGKIEMTLKTLFQIAEVLEMHPAEFFEHNNKALIIDPEEG